MKLFPKNPEKNCKIYLWAHSGMSYENSIFTTIINFLKAGYEKINYWHIK